MNLKQLLLAAIGLFFFSTTYAQIDFQIHEVSESSLSVLDPQAVFAADLDGDGDMDALSASQGDDKIAWFENIDGLGDFGPLKIIAEDIPGGNELTAADIDGDGDIDVLSTSYSDDFVAWHENTDGLGNFGPSQIIGTSLNQARKVYASDIDGDMNLDVVTVSSSGLDWFQNMDGQGDFGGPNQIDNSGDVVWSAYPFDIDGDGDIDMLCGSTDNDIFWYENTDGLGNFGAGQEISATGGSFLMELLASDLDNDGDLDIITGSPNLEVLAWYENEDGLGTFGAQQILGTNLSYILRKEQVLKRYWVGEIGTYQLAHHQMIEVTKNKIYLYDLDEIVDSLNRNELNMLTQKDGTYKGRLRLLGNDKLLVKSLVKKTNRKPCNIFYAKKATELNCSTETRHRFEDGLSESYIVITEEGVFYAMTQVESIADKRKYEIQEAKFLKIQETYFLQPIDKGSNKNIMVPIFEITDEYFLVFDWELNEMIKILLENAE